MPQRRTWAVPRRGTTIVEMAIVAPLFFMLILGIFEFDRMVMIKQALTHGAREGCREAVLSTTLSQSSVDAAIRGHLAAAIPAANDTNLCRISMTPANFASTTVGTDVTVSVEVNFADVTWLPVRFLGNTVLRGNATMKRE